MKKLLVHFLFPLLFISCDMIDFLVAELSPYYHFLSIDIEGMGDVIVKPDRKSFKDGSTAEISAVPDPGWYFSGWSGDFFDTSESIQVLMTSDKYITARFTEHVPYTGRNNSTVFLSETFYIGNAISSTANLTHPIHIINQSQHPFLAGTAYAIRWSIDSQFTEVLVFITNVSSSDSFAFIKAENINLLNGSGSSLFFNSYSYVHGSVGRLSNVTTHSALAPGETGYIFVLPPDDIWSEVSAISFTLSYSPSQVYNPLAKVVPVNFNFIDDGYSDFIEVEFQNQSSVRAVIENIGNTFIIFDSNDIPITFGYISDLVTPVSRVIEPYSVGRMQDDFITDGYGRKVLVSLCYNDIDLSNTQYERLVAKLFPVGQMGLRELSQYYDQRCAILEKLLGSE